MLLISSFDSVNNENEDLISNDWRTVKIRIILLFVFVKFSPS